MKSNPLILPPAPCSAQELELIELFIREQSSVVIRACRMEVAQTPESRGMSEWMSLMFPWIENRELHLKLETYKRGIALQLLLEKQLIEALTYLHNPNEDTRDLFVKGAFKALYSCEEYAFGDKATIHIQEIINRLGLQFF